MFADCIIYSQGAPRGQRIKIYAVSIFHTSQCYTCSSIQKHSRAVNFRELLGVRNQKIVFCTSQTVQFWLEEKVTSKKQKQKEKKKNVLFFLLLLTYVVCRRFYMFHSFLRERCSLCGRFYMLGGREGETVSRRETPFLCGRVDSPERSQIVNPGLARINILSSFPYSPIFSL